jgi:hypothetical protein
VFSYADEMSLLLVLFVFLCGTGRFPMEPAEDRGTPFEGAAHAAELPPGEFQSVEAGAIPDEQARIAGAPLLASVFFERGSCELGEEARARLAELAPFLWRSRRPLLVIGHVSPLVERHAALPQADPRDRAFERALAVVAYLEELDGGGSRRRTLELIAGSAGHQSGEREGLGADLHDGRDRVDIVPLGVPRRMP